jgi:hypothetical protein
LIKWGGIIDIENGNEFESGKRLRKKWIILIKI